MAVTITAHGPTALRDFGFPDQDADVLTAAPGVRPFAVGDLVYASDANTLAKLADVATGNVLLSGGVTTAPAWGKVGLTTHVTGTLPKANGGTGNTNGTADTLTTPRAIYGNNFDGSAALAQIIASTFGGTGNGFTKFSGPAASEKTFTLPNASATILTDNAAVTVAQGGTGLATLTAHALYVGNGTSAPTALAVGATGTVLAGATGADPGWTATPTVTSLQVGTGVGVFFGGTTASFPALKRSSTTLAVRLADDSADAPMSASVGTFSGNVIAGSGSTFLLSGRGGLQATADGVFLFANNAGTDVSRIMFGGSTASFPALKRSGTTLQHRLADDSADGPMSASTGTFSSSVTMGGTTAATRRLTVFSADSQQIRMGSSDSFFWDILRDINGVLSFINESSKSFSVTAAGNLSVGGGSVLAYAGGDENKILFLNSATKAKIAHSSGFSVDFYSGDTGTTSSGVFSWKTVTSGGAFANAMTLSNAGALAALTSVDSALYKVGGVSGIDATITTSSLVGKTITVSKGIITGFA